MVTILMMSTKMATLGLLQIKIFWNKGYKVPISVHDVNNTVLLRDSNYIADLVMWRKFGNSSISMREVIINLVLWGCDQKNHLFEGCSWFKFNSLRLALGIALKLYTSAAKGLNLKVRMLWDIISTFVEVKWEKPFCFLHLEQG